MVKRSLTMDLHRPSLFLTDAPTPIIIFPICVRRVRPADDNPKARRT